MSPVEAQFLFARLLVLAALYVFLAGVAVLSYRELRLPVTPPAQHADVRPGTRLIVLDGANSGRAAGTAFVMEPSSTIGRDLDNQVVLVDATISGHHAVVHRRDGGWWIEDLHSTNGTFVNGQPIAAEAPALLRSGDVIQVGAVRLRLVSPDL